jgi:Lar family restriction alleviation protein
MSDRTTITLAPPGILPCPFCGSADLGISPNAGRFRHRMAVCCRTCLAYGPERICCDDAIAAWNKRSAPGAEVKP